MMFAPLMRQLLRGRRPPALVDEGELPYHDVPRLTSAMTETSRELRDRGYVDYPVFVHLETLAICNAACSFCPYPTLDRKGVKMPDATVEKVINDLTVIPPHFLFRFAPYKVSDPFLEPRLFDIIELAESKLSNMRVTLITNGSALTERKIEELKKVKRVNYLTVSLNFDDEEEYERVMQLSFRRTLERLDMLHKKVAAKELAFPVRVSRVSGGRQDDESFLRFVRARYPAFPVYVVPRNDWIGEVVTEGALNEVPDAPCHRWFDLSITATGDVAMCCMDGRTQYSHGNVNNEHALKIYNHPTLRALRKNLASRRATGAPCDRCTYLAS